MVETVRLVEARGSLDVSRRLKQDISQVFRFAIAHGWAKIDPARDIGAALRPRPRTQHMSRIPLSEIGTFLDRLSRYDGEKLTQQAIRLTLLTWARTTEIRGAEWSEFRDDLWVIPAERMKMGREHVVPLSRQAREVLAGIPRNSKWLFHRRGKMMSQNTMLFGLYRMGYQSRMTIHGIRALASTWANEQFVNGVRRYDSDWIERSLAHVEDNEVRGAYNAAEYLPQRRAMLQDWADFLDVSELVG